MGSPERFLIQHQYVPGKNGGLAVDRHVVRVEKTKAASGDYPEEMLSVNLTITCPRGRTTAAEAKDAVGEIVDFVNDLTILTRLLNSDVIAEP